MTTTLVALLKRERTEPCEHRATQRDDLNIVDSYKLLLRIIQMRSIRILAAILLTVKFTFAACDSVTSLKLVEAGVPKDKLALLAVPLVPLQIVLPLVVSKYTNGPKPMEVYIKAIPYRIAFAIGAMAIVWLTPFTIASDGTVPIYLYVILIINYAFYQICLYGMFVAVMAFFAKISDPTVGGTYMTLLNTVCNLGGNWPTSIVLWLVDVLTWKQCSLTGTHDARTHERHGNISCLNKAEEDVSLSLKSTHGPGQCDHLIFSIFLVCRSAPVWAVNAKSPLMATTWNASYASCTASSGTNGAHETFVICKACR